MAQHEFGHGKRIENSTDPPNSLRKHVRVATHTRRNAYACSIPDLPRSEHLRHYRVLQCTKRSRSMTRTHVSGDFYVRRAQGFHEQRHCTGGRWAVALQGHFTDLIECALVWQRLPNDGSGAVTAGPGCARLQPSVRWPTSGRRTRRRGSRGCGFPGLVASALLLTLPPLILRLGFKRQSHEAHSMNSGTNNQIPLPFVLSL